MSNRPWYYVKGHGNREYIERLIASKRDKEARQSEFRRQTSDYFDRWQLQNEWMGRKGSKKQTANSNQTNSAGKFHSKVPYDLDYEIDDDPKRSESIKLKRNKARKELKVLLEQLIDLEKEAKESEEQQLFLIKQIENLLLVRRQLKDKQENWSIRGKKMYYKRFAKDKMRLKSFLICEQLNSYKIVIQCLSKSIPTVFLSKREKEELYGVIESSLNIINMYLDINYKRNYELIPLYNEEAEKKWLECESNWERERSIWYNLVDRVIEAFFTTHKYQLEDNLESLEILTEKRIALLDQMLVFSEKLKQDNDLMVILSEDMDHLIDNDNFKILSHGN
ncbi:trichoplein keratin filament-binding protein-like [Tetranychus urticae]|uniref:Uncharacterized protein n=1 Tax=Tetranychus urticae TaxID=32264 RepID=T1JQH2_TETUR|nr:trichoplein keratin filament-binding protein-like [Tetranychus urticae]